jgi:hypothetical protein
MTTTTKKNIETGKILERLYKALRETEQDIIDAFAKIHTYEMMIASGLDDTGRTIAAADKVYLQDLINNLRDDINADGDLAWWLRREIATMINDAVAEANSWFLSLGNNLGSAKSRFVSPK